MSDSFRDLTLAEGLQSSLFDLQLPGRWRFFNRGRRGRFVYGLSNTPAGDQWVVSDLWNERQIVLTDGSPIEHRRRMPETRVFDFFAFSDTRVVIFWQPEPPFSEFVLSVVTFDFTGGTFVAQHTIVGSGHKNVENYHYQELITPIKDDSNSQLLIRFPYKRTCVLFDLDLKKVVRLMELCGPDLSEIFRLHCVHDSDDIKWLYAWDEIPHTYSSSRQFHMEMPKLSRVRLDNSGVRLVGEERGIPVEALTFERIYYKFKPRIGTRIFKRTATMFSGQTAFVLYRATAFLKRLRCPPDYYRLFQVDLPTFTWSELKFAPDFLRQVPQQTPHGFETMHLTDGVLEINVVFGQNIPDSRFSISIAVNNVFIDPGKMIGYRLALRQPESLTMLAYFGMPKSLKAYVPKNFHGRPVF